MQDSEQRKVLVVQTLMDFCINKNTPRIVSVTFFTPLPRLPIVIHLAFDGLVLERNLLIVLGILW